MSDGEGPDRLAPDTAVPGPDHARATLQWGHRARRRRVMAWATGVAVVMVMLVTAVLVMPSVISGRDKTTSPSADAEQQVMVTVSRSPTAVQPVSAEAAVYAAAIQALADEVREGGPPWPVLYVLDHTCANIVTPPGAAACGPQALSAVIRRDLTAALASYAPVQFITDGAEVTDPNAGLVVANGGVQVNLGPMQLQDTQARVPLSVRRNGLNGRGVTYQLTRHGQTWRVGGTVGLAWIS